MRILQADAGSSLSGVLGVANEIARQIGQRALFMLGARYLVGGPDVLTFQITRSPKRVTHVRVTLTPADLYRVEFLRCARGISSKPPITVSELDGVYADSLRMVLERHTGLAVSL